MKYRAHLLSVAAPVPACLALFTSGCETASSTPAVKKTAKVPSSKKHYEYVSVVGSNVPKRVLVSDEGIYTDENGNPLPSPYSPVNQHQFDQIQRNQLQVTPSGGGM